MVDQVFKHSACSEYSIFYRNGAFYTSIQDNDPIWILIRYNVGRAGERYGCRSSGVQGDGYRTSVLHEVDKAQFHDRLQHGITSPRRGGE